MMLYLVGSTGSAYFTVYAIERFAVGTGAVTGFTVAMSLGAGAAGLVAGRAARVIGFVRILLVGLGLTAGAMATAAAAQTAGWLYVTFFLTGAGGVAASMAFINLPLELAERTDAPTYFAVAFLVRGPAGALAPVAAGLYLTHYPHPPLYVFCAVVSLAAAGLLQRFVHEAPRSPTPSPPSRPSA
jgi:MFS family permease